jgi:hypothetical protein
MLARYCWYGFDAFRRRSTCECVVAVTSLGVAMMLFERGQGSVQYSPLMCLHCT